MANRTLYHGDNLKFLRGINTGTMNLIATDPPFNKNKDFYATPDSLARGASFTDRWRWEEDVHPEWVDTIQDDWPGVWQVIEASRIASGDDMAAFLCWLGVRLLEMHRVLKDDGSLYLHIDHTAHAWVKALMDGVFGRNQFRNEIVWCYTGPSNAKRYFQRKHDTILFYAKSPRTAFNADDVRVPYKGFGIQGDNPKRGIFRGGANRERVQELVNKGKVPTDWWADDNLTNVSAWMSERTGYPTQKPLGLYERIIKASSNPGDFVLDPFAGCATTPVAAERLGRHWIGMDIWDGAYQMVIDRLRDEGLAIDGEHGERLTFGDIHYSTAPPIRTDDKQVASRVLNLKVHIPEPPGKKMSRAEMMDVLIQNNGLLCKGCNRFFDDPLYLELDHNTPRSDGGLNHISNRVLLCSPCNRIKSNTLTLSGLRRKNNELGRMAK